MNDLVWVGIDPGYGERNATGWAIVDDAYLLACGTLRVHGGDDDVRLRDLAEQLRSTLDANIPTDRPWGCGCELPIFGPNMRVIATLARINGLVTGYCAERGRRVYSVQPSAAKLALTGNGAADKAADDPGRAAAISAVCACGARRRGGRSRHRVGGAGAVVSTGR